MEFDHEAFKKIRIDLRWTLSSIAEKVGVTRRTAYNWENGLTKPSVKVIFELAYLLGISPHVITDIEPASKTSNVTLSKATKSWISLFHDRSSHQKEINQMSANLERLHNKLNDASLIIIGLLSSINFPMYIKDTKQKYVMVNTAFLKNLALDSNTKFAGKKDHYFFPKHEADKNLEEDVGVLAGEKSIINKEYYIPGSKKKKWGLINKVPIYDENEELAGLIGIFIDITARKKEEEKRQAAEETNKTLLKLFDIASEVVVYRKYSKPEKQWMICYVNKAIEKLAGESSEFFHGTMEVWADEFVHPEDRDKYKEWSRKYDELEQELEYRVINRKLEKILWVQEKHYFKNNVFYSVGCDITELKKTTKILKIFMKSIDKLNDVITLIGPIPSYSYVYKSKGCEKLYGYPKENFLDENFFIDVCVHPDDREMMQNYRKEQQEHVVQCRIVRPDGEIRWIESCCVLDRKMGEYFVVIDRDITDEKIKEETEYKQKLMESIKALKKRGVDSNTIYEVYREFTPQEIDEL